MNIFWWIVKNILWTFSTFFYKKSLLSRPNLLVNAFLTSIYHFFAGFFILSLFALEPILYVPVIVLFAWNFIRYFTSILEQKVYQDEKISALIPYSNLNIIMWMIIAFFVFWGVSWISFVIALIIVILSIVPNLKFNKSSGKKISKMVLLYVWLQIIRAIIYVSEWYVILKMIAFDFFVLNIFSYWFAWVCISFVLFRIKKVKLDDFKMNKPYHISKFVENIIYVISSYLSAFLIVELWLIVSSILWFLWTWMTLIMSYFAFWDKPSKKDLILTIVITILVFLWFYFKDYWL